MADNLQKKPPKSILRIDPNKPSGSKRQKETKFDEENVLKTLHPEDKDYGHMRIDEPKTPYHTPKDAAPVDPKALQKKLEEQAGKLPKVMLSDDDDELTAEERAKKKLFEERRKKHYNEYQQRQLAKKLMEEDSDDDDDKKRRTGISRLRASK